MVKSWTVIVASTILLVALIVNNCHAKLDYEDLDEKAVCSECGGDWETFKKTNFDLNHRLELNNKITYQVSYHGNNISSDLDTLGNLLIGSHESEIIILVQSPHNKEIVTYMYENGEVVKVK